MTLHQLEVFASIAKRLNVSQSQLSRELRVSQPAISQQLKFLEADLGGAMFTRNGRGLVLTERGQAIREDVEAILGQVDALKKKYAGPQEDQTKKSLTLGGSHGPSTSVLPSLMTLFKKHHPSAEIELKAGSSPDMQDLVLNSEVELAVITNPYPSSSLEMEPFGELKLCVFVATHHPLANRKEIKPEELALFPLIIGRTRKGRSRSHELLGSMAARGLKLNVLMRCEWPDAVKAVVREGEAIGMLYEDVVEEAVSNGLFKIIKVAGLNLTVLSYIVYSRERPLSQNAQDFLALLRAARGKSPSSKTAVQAGKASSVPCSSTQGG